MDSRHSISLTRRVLAAVGLLGSAQIVNILCSVIRIKLIAVWLDRAGVGLNAILVNGSSLVSTATQLNIRESAVRDVSALAPGDQRDIKNAIIRRWSIILGLAGATIMILISPLLSATSFAGSYAYTLHFALLSPFVFFSACSAGEFAVMQGCGHLNSLAKANVASGIAATAIAIPLLYFFGMSAIVAVIDIYAAAGAVCAFIWRERPRRLTVRIDRHMLWSGGKGFLTLGLSISVAMLLTTLMQYALTAYINSVSGEAALGVYQSGYTMVNSYVGILFSAITLEYYPRLVRFVGTPRLCRTIVAHEIGLVVRLLIPVAVIFICASDMIVKLLYSSKFDAVMPFITFAIIGAILRGVSLCFAFRIIAAGDSKAYFLTEAASVVVGLALNIAGYHYWSYAGLGLAYVAWYAFYALLTAAVCRRRYGLRIAASQIWLIISAVAITGLAILMKQAVGWWLPAVSILPWLIPLVFRRIMHRRRTSS